MENIVQSQNQQIDGKRRRVERVLCATMGTGWILCEGLQLDPCKPAERVGD